MKFVIVSFRVQKSLHKYFQDLFHHFSFRNSCQNGFVFRRNVNFSVINKNCPFCGQISNFRVQKSLQKYICNNKRNLFIHKRLNKLSWIICIWIGLSFNWQNQADKAQERNLKRVQVYSSPFSPPLTHFTRPPSTVTVNFESFWFLQKLWYGSWLYGTLRYAFIRGNSSTGFICFIMEIK